MAGQAHGRTGAFQVLSHSVLQERSSPHHVAVLRYAVDKVQCIGHGFRSNRCQCTAGSSGSLLLLAHSHSLCLRLQLLCCQDQLAVGAQLLPQVLLQHIMQFRHAIQGQTLLQELPQLWQ